jgi:hypothetical protein
MGVTSFLRTVEKQDLADDALRKGKRSPLILRRVEGSSAATRVPSRWMDVAAPVVASD